MPRQTTPGRPQRRAAGRGPGGAPADRLVRAWLDGDDEVFEDLAEACIAGVRMGCSRREGLKVPPRQPKRGRLWLNDGSCIRLRPERPNHAWSHDSVEDRTHDGRKFRTLNVLAEFTRECLAIRVGRRLKATDVIDPLSDPFILRGVPAHIRPESGPEFVSQAVQGWISAVGARTAYIAPRGPWENG